MPQQSPYEQFLKREMAAEGVQFGNKTAFTGLDLYIAEEGVTEDPERASEQLGVEVSERIRSLLDHGELGEKHRELYQRLLDRLEEGTIDPAMAEELAMAEDISEAFLALKSGSDFREKESVSSPTTEIMPGFTPSYREAKAALARGIEIYLKKNWITRAVADRLNQKHPYYSLPWLRSLVVQFSATEQGQNWKEIDAQQAAEAREQFFGIMVARLEAAPSEDEMIVNGLQETDDPLLQNAWEQLEAEVSQKDAEMAENTGARVKQVLRAKHNKAARRKQRAFAREEAVRQASQMEKFLTELRALVQRYEGKGAVEQFGVVLDETGITKQYPVLSNIVKEELLELRRRHEVVSEGVFGDLFAILEESRKRPELLVPRMKLTYGNMLPVPEKIAKKDQFWPDDGAKVGRLVKRIHAEQKVDEESEDQALVDAWNNVGVFFSKGFLTEEEALLLLNCDEVEEINHFLNQSLADRLDEAITILREREALEKAKVDNFPAMRAQQRWGNGKSDQPSKPRHFPRKKQSPVAQLAQTNGHFEFETVRNHETGMWEVVRGITHDTERVIKKPSGRRSGRRPIRPAKVIAGKPAKASANPKPRARF